MNGLNVKSHLKILSTLLSDVYLISYLYPLCFCSSFNEVL